MTDRELMQQALEALTAYDGTNGESKRKRVLADLRERLAQREQEPFCYHDGRDVVGKEYADHSDVFPLYTAPRQWQGLTDEERNNLWRDVIGWGDPSHDDEDLMKAIEARLKEKNG